MHPLFDLIDLIQDPEPLPAALNMAVDEILLQGINRPLLRIYQWRSPAVSLGYFEPYQAVQAEYPDREPVRRWTGGGIVLHGEDLTYSLILPKKDPFFQLKTAESYRAIHERIAETMNRQGVSVVMADAASQKISQACFENPAQHDILSAENKKIAGAAQRRTKFGLLHQGSIQNMTLPVSFGGSLAAELAEKVSAREIDPTEWERAKELVQTKYATDAWMLKF